VSYKPDRGKLKVFDMPKSLKELRHLAWRRLELSLG
jgi:hypothetical protein